MSSPPAAHKHEWTGLVSGDTRAILTGRLRAGTAFAVEYRVTVR